MSKLKHEVWIDREGLPGLCLSGPGGDGFRALLGAGSRLVNVFEASSHFEAMSRYYELMDWGPYTTDFQEDHEPYPAEWAFQQEAAPSEGDRS